MSKIALKDLTEKVVATAGDNVPAEIEYKDASGTVVGYWAYGEWQPDYPYQGGDMSKEFDDWRDSQTVFTRVQLSGAEQCYDLAVIFDAGRALGRDEGLEEITDLKDRLENGIRYDEEQNQYILIWTKREIDQAKKEADEICKKLGILKSA